LKKSEVEEIQDLVDSKKAIKRSKKDLYEEARSLDGAFGFKRPKAKVAGAFKKSNRALLQTSVRSR
jgi:hypothetical protein